MPFPGAGLIGFAIGPDQPEFPRIDECAGRESPLGEGIGVPVGQKDPVQGDNIGARIVEFNPGIVLAKAVGRAGDIVGLHLVEPE